MPLRALSAAAVVLISLAPAVARAEEPASPDATASRRPVTLTLNPLAPMVGRWGGNVEWSPIVHHGMIVSLAYVSRADCCVTVSDASSAGASAASSSWLHGAVGELGYRYYTGTRGPEGFFVGPSLVVGVVGMGAEGTVPTIGGAFDAGGQVMLGGFTFGAGIGVQALYASRSVTPVNDPSVNALTQTAVTPRLLLSVGYAL